MAKILCYPLNENVMEILFTLKSYCFQMRSREAPPSKLLSQLFLKIKGSRCKGDPDFAFVCQS